MELTSGQSNSFNRENILKKKYLCQYELENDERLHLLSK